MANSEAIQAEPEYLQCAFCGPDSKLNLKTIVKPVGRGEDVVIGVADDQSEWVQIGDYYQLASERNLLAVTNKLLSQDLDKLKKELRKPLV